MTLPELAKYLHDEGYNDQRYHVGPGWQQHCDDCYCLDRSAAGFEIFFVERGGRVGGPASFSTTDEAEACARYLEMVKSWPGAKIHLIGYFRSRENADELGRSLREHGIPYEITHPSGKKPAPGCT